jgi:ech hydrogenase subunit D
MSDEQSLEQIDVEILLDRVRSLRAEGYRLVQVCATRLPEEFELTYSFDRDQRLQSLRLLLPAANPRVPSICAIYGCVLLYENEMHDLFGIQVEGMTVNFQGNLYRTAVKFPFGSTKPPSAPEKSVQPAPAAAPASATPD